MYLILNIMTLKELENRLKSFAYRTIKVCEAFTQKKIDIENTWQKFLGEKDIKISNNFVCEVFCVPLFSITSRTHKHA